MMLEFKVDKMMGHVKFGPYWWEETPEGLQYCIKIRRYDGEGNLESEEICRGGYLTYA